MRRAYVKTRVNTKYQRDKQHPKGPHHAIGKQGEPNRAARQQRHDGGTKAYSHSNGYVRNHDVPPK